MLSILMLDVTLANVMIFMRYAISAVIVLAWTASAPAWAAGYIYVYDAAGEVSAAVGKSASQRIVKNDALKPDTLVNTGNNSYAVLKFEDGQIVTLQSNSSFEIRKYDYDAKQSSQGSAVFSMLKGGMRFVTGLIGQRNKKAFRLSTPNATIGIRGTEFMVALVDGAVYSQVVSGGIRMTNPAGTSVFSAGQNAVVASATSTPTTIAASALPAGTFTQLQTIATLLVSSDSAPASPVKAALTNIDTPPIAVVAAATPPAIPPVTPPEIDLFAPREPSDLAFFKPVPAASAVSDAALVGATGVGATGNPGASEISRSEAAASLFGKHNFTATGVATGEICAFCHAPQGAESRVAAPLWNRSLSPLSSYQAYSTLGSADTAAAGSVSMACLSCHDGTQAPNVAINTPPKDSDPDSINGNNTDSSLYLNSHHPVGMQYGGGGQDQSIPGAPLKLEDFRSTTYSGTGTGTVWWVDNGGAGRQSTDILLFSRSDTPEGESSGRPYVECASCHDPHRITTPTFLRAANANGSGLCMSCHSK